MKHPYGYTVSRVVIPVKAGIQSAVRRIPPFSERGIIHSSVLSTLRS